MISYIPTARSSTTPFLAYMQSYIYIKCVIVMDCILYYLCTTIQTTWRTGPCAFDDSDLGLPRLIHVKNCTGRLMHFWRMYSTSDLGEYISNVHKLYVVVHNFIVPCHATIRDMTQTGWIRFCCSFEMGLFCTMC